MDSKRLIPCVCLIAGLFCFNAPANADTYQLILQGKVTMADGSPPPQSVGIERVCSDTFGSAPGPITDKKTGAWVWHMEVDPMLTRQCSLRATLKGYTSTQISISSLNSYSDPNLPPLVLTAAGGDPNTLTLSNDNIPSKAAPAWKAAVKALDSQNLSEVSHQLEIAVEAAPKFTQGWNTLGLVDEKQNRFPRAREAFQHAIESDPKNIAPYLSVTRVCIKAKDWDGALKAADALIKADTKKMFPDVYLHEAVAKYWLKDYDGAQASAEKAIAQDKVHHRSEYVLGRILEAKGDSAGAIAHITKYIELDPSSSDAEQVVAHLSALQKPGLTAVEPDLEVF
jgi:cytochrome c-type biogenesis protein CcmH/NrfG